MAASVDHTLDQLYRAHAAQLTAACTSYFGLINLATAEDIVQDTFASALSAWQAQGIPENPQSWLYKVCKNKALNLIAKEKVGREHHLSLPSEQEIDGFFLPNEIDDQQLCMLFTSAIPSFSPRMRMIFVLRVIHGIRSKAVADLLLMTDDAVQKTYERARHRISKAHHALSVPDIHQSKSRLIDVINALYLTYSLGYDQPWQKDTGNDLCFDALRLTRLLCMGIAAEEPMVQALYSLMLFHTSRLASRVTPDGALVDLEHQDRSKWNAELIKLAIVHLNKAQYMHPPSKYHLEATIASLHCTAASFAQTPWTRIVSLYLTLDERFPSPFVKLNLAVGLMYAQGPDAALRYIQGHHFSAFAKSHQYHATLSKIYHVAGCVDQAIDHLQLAIQFAPSLHVRSYLEKRLLALQAKS